MEIRLHLDLNRPRWSRNWSLKRKVLLFLALVLLLTPVAFVAANDVFSDVPSNSPFHNDINAIYGARITNGTSPGIYSPGLNVTRDQMAAFLHRGLPRVAYNYSGAPAGILNSFQDRGVVTINTGGAAGGKGFVKLEANLRAYTNYMSGCPCELQFAITRDGGGQSPDWFVAVNNSQGGVDSNTSASVSWVVSVPTASTQTFRLRVKKNSGIADVLTTGAITALYVPFGNTGQDVLAAQALESQAVSDTQEVKTQTMEDLK